MDAQKMLRIFQKSYDEQVDDLKLKISYAEGMIEAWISALGKVLDTLLEYLSSADQQHLLKTGISLRDNLIQRYLWQEGFLESQIYYHVTLQRRLQFAEVLRANTKIVKHHYYSNCIHYIPEKSKYDIVLSLEIKLNLISAMKNRMEIFESKVLRQLMKTSTSSSKKNLKNSLEGLLLMTSKQNDVLENELKKSLKKIQEREQKILAMEEGYFTAAAKKFNSEQWLSQGDIERKVTLLRVEPTKRRKIDILCGSCLREQKYDIPSNTQFTNDEESFKTRVATFFQSY
jgi:hypothetical protein